MKCLSGSAGSERTFKTTYVPMRVRVRVCVRSSTPPHLMEEAQSTLNRTPMKLVFPQIKPGVN